MAMPLEDLKRFVRFPSVSAQSAHAGHVRACAAWLAKHLQGIGMAGVRVIATPRHPIVYAEWNCAPRRPTVLIYGHYDVQPPDPLREWTTPPFEPTVRGSHLYGRGACDDKGQLFAHVKALERFLKAALLDRHHPVMRAAARAYQRGFGTAPVYLRSGGSIPVVNLFQEILGIPTALMGFALPDSHIHAPNERFHLPTFERAITTCRAFLQECVHLTAARRNRATPRRLEIFS